MKCSETRAFLGQIESKQEPLPQIPPADLDYLTSNGYVLRTSKDEYDRGATEVSRLSDLVARVASERGQEEQQKGVLQADERRAHGFTFHFEGREEREQLSQRVQTEAAAFSKEEAEVASMDANVNALIQEKSTMDRMVAYDGGYLSLTGPGSVVLNDLGIRNYRVADDEFSDFSGEIKATYSELRTIADKASFYVVQTKARVPAMEADEPKTGDEAGSDMKPRAPSVLWGTAIGMAKLRGDPNLILQRFGEALDLQGASDFENPNIPNILMASEVIASMESQEVRDLVAALVNLEMDLRDLSVPDDSTPAVAAALMAGKRFDGTFPTDRFALAKKLTSSYEAASILSVLNVPFDGLSSKFQEFRAKFASWGYTASNDIEIASAFMAIGELEPNDVDEKLKYIVEQLKNYLEYPLVPAAILASLSVLEAHEALDLMEKAVTLLTDYAVGLERSELVALAVRMIHGVRNELVKKIDPTATITQTPVQFTYPIHPGLFIWYHPVIIAHMPYHVMFGGMGAFHPEHSHGIGGFAG